MKGLMLVLALGLCASAAHAQMSCCTPTSTAEFAALGTNAEFVAAHESPLPAAFAIATGKMISFRTADGKEGHAYLVKSERPTKNVLFLTHEYWGLNAYIKREAERWQRLLGDVDVYALDLYDGKTTTDPKEAGKLMAAARESRIRAIIAGAIAHVGPDKHIATLGWCFGGGWSLQASLMAGPQAAACVMFYGMPEKSVDRLRTLHADVLGIFGSQDNWITPAVVAQFEKDMKAAGKSLTVKSYDAVHAFANPSNPKYDKKAATEANAIAQSFLLEHLGIKK